MLFRMLGGQATLAGMSGGLGTDAAGHFAGILYGRRRDRYNLLIPASHVVAAWNAVRKASAAPWAAFRPQEVTGEILYRGDADEGDKTAAEDRLDWSTFDGLKALLGDDPARQIERFEEIKLTPRLAGKNAPPLRIYVDPDSVPNQRHALQIWHDGNKVEWNRDTGIALVRISDKPGESLLTVLKTSGGANDLELGGLLLPSTIDLEFSQGDSPVPIRHIVRSLPVIAHEYPLFITLRTPPGSEPRGPASGARLAVRLDYLEALLNRAPFDIKVAGVEGDPKNPGRSAEFDAVFRLGAKGGWRLRALSPQRLEVTLTGEVRLNKARYRDFTLSPRRAPGEPAGALPAFTVRGILQFPYVMPQAGSGAGAGLALSARAIGTSGTGSWRIEVGRGPDVSFDVGGILRHLFTCWVNKRLIAADEPHLVNQAMMQTFFAALGLDRPANLQTRVLRVGFLRDDAPDPKDWVVVLSDLGGAGGPVGFGPVPSSNDSLVFEVRVWGVPGRIVKGFPNLRPAGPEAALLEQAKVRSLCLTLRLDGGPDTWFPKADPGQAPPVLNEGGGEAAARRVLELFRDSTARGKVGLSGSQ
jgi:hypothetical protein